jgi:hypothetical protein
MREAGEPLWQCQNANCHAVLPATELRHIITPQVTLSVCPRCGGPVVRARPGLVAAAGATMPAEKPVPSFASALLYPFHGWGWAALGVGTVLVGLLAFGLPFLYGYVISMLVYGYLCNYLFDIVLTTANDQDAPPDFPDFTSWWEDVIQPMLLMLSTTLLCFAPAVLYFVGYLVKCWYEGWIPEPDEPMCAVGVLGLMFVCAFYYPMALLGVVMHNSRRALDPRFVVPAIRRVLAPYLIVCGFLILTGAVQVGFRLIFRGESLRAHFAAVFLNLWGLMVSMRLLGLLYRAHKDKLGWF